MVEYQCVSRQLQQILLAIEETDRVVMRHPMTGEPDMPSPPPKTSSLTDKQFAAIEEMRAIAKKHDLGGVAVFTDSEANLHPAFFFDADWIDFISEVENIQTFMLGFTTTSSYGRTIQNGIAFTSVAMNLEQVGNHLGKACESLRKEIQKAFDKRSEAEATDSVEPAPEAMN
jgi:glycine cleavage system aminomethyltransferase T